jgi:hypothetical protein
MLSLSTCRIGVGALGRTEVKHIPGLGRDALPRLAVRDLVLALNDDLHLVVGVGVDQRLALFEAVESRRDGFLGVDFVAGKVSISVSLAGCWVWGGGGGGAMWKNWWAGESQSTGPQSTE